MAGSASTYGPGWSQRAISIAPSGSLTRPLTRGSLGEVIEDDRLVVPSSFYEFLAKNGVRNAPSAFSFLATNPSAIMHITGWDVDDVRRATERLRETLRGHVPESLLEDAPTTERVYGAFPPRR